jgi:hypothetical protein
MVQATTDVRGRLRGIIMSKRSLSSISAAIAALLLVPTAVSAEPPPATITFLDREKGGDVIVDGEPVVCEFAIELDFEVDEPVPVVGWAIKVWASTAFDGETVLAGTDGPTEDAGLLRQPRDGWVTLPDGRYNLLVDDETPVDRSFLRQPFTVECEADATPPPPEEEPTEAPTQAPTVAPTQEPAPTEAPTETPDGGVLPTQGVATETPGGQGAVLPTQEVAETTLPPTDTSGGPSAGTSSALPILGILALVSLGVLGLTPARRARED